MKERHKVLVAAYLILERDGKVFLMRRAGTGWRDGEYGLPSGHLEEGEHPSQSAAREGHEESGVIVDPAAIECVHVCHRDQNEDGKEYVDFFFVARNWEGEPSNMEPEKCDDCAWFVYHALPQNTIDYVARVLGYVKQGRFFSEQ